MTGNADYGQMIETIMETIMEMTTKTETCIETEHSGQNRFGVIIMTTVSPAVKDKFETLSVDLKNAILERNETINTIHDLIRVLEDIVKENGQ